MVNSQVSISASSALLFALVNLPFTYQLTSRVLDTYDWSTGCPTQTGLLVHTAVFFVLSYLGMGRQAQGTKLKHSAIAAVLFLLASSPTLYAFVGSFLGTATEWGCPTLAGVLVHAFVYFLLLLAYMRFV